MDPNVTWSALVTAIEAGDRETAVEGLASLQAWLARGGFRPVNLPPHLQGVSAVQLAAILSLLQLAYTVPAPTSVGLSEAAKAQYVKSGGAACPFCGGTDLVGDSVTIEGGTASQEISCSVCHESWIDGYTLTDVSRAEDYVPASNASLPFPSKRG